MGREILMDPQKMDKIFEFKEKNKSILYNHNMIKELVSQANKNSIPGQWAVIIILRFYAYMSYREIAKLLRDTHGNIYKKEKSALKRIKKLFLLFSSTYTSSLLLARLLIIF